MDKNVIDGSYTRYRMPSERGLAKDLANGTVKKEVHHINHDKRSISESYVIEHNSVK
ncbi:hypothetical protein [Pelosinus sp. sgz500959]|uniref:hypothetical protein n=1 Tax=Pelosinus sp. sgz500959 TaxID=3242472 RepID=UPI00366D5D23